LPEISQLKSPALKVPLDESQIMALKKDKSYISQAFAAKNEPSNRTDHYDPKMNRLTNKIEPKQPT